MDFAIGFIAYITFTTEVQGNVLLNFSPDSWTAIIARVALLDLVVLSYSASAALDPIASCLPCLLLTRKSPDRIPRPSRSVIMMIPCKLSLIDLIFGKNEARLEASPTEFYGVTLALNIVALLVALSVSDLSLVLSLNGAVCTNVVAFILPVRIRSTL